MPTQARRVAITVVEVLALAVIVTLLMMLIYQVGVAAADTGSGSGAVPTPDTDPGGFIEATFSAARSGNWTAVAAAVLIGITWLARKPWALGRWAFFKTDRGGVAMALGLSLVGGLGHAIAAMGEFPTDLATYKAIGMTAVTAMGGYAALKRLIWPADKKPDVVPAPATP